MSFILQRRTPIDTLHLEVQEYRHAATGAIHIHLACHDIQNAFLVAFRTIPQDSTGVAHILEHTALCGSRRFPVRDPFFMMTRRSLNTFMNAFTASDWTAYPFASCNRKDFDNLLQVYLDAAFFPLLDELDFLQEGHRLEFAEMDNPNSPLEFKGVVYNEMKGAMSAPTSRLWQALHEHVFPTQTYHYNSGGEPRCIPDLTHAQLKAFHARHYHPSNAIFMTYGDIPASEHQHRFETHVLCHFSADDSHIRVGTERRFPQPIRAHAYYPTEPGQPTARKTHILLAWLLEKNTDADAVMTAHLLNGVLLDHGGSPLRQALERSDLGEAPSPLCGLSDTTLEMVFACGFEGSDAEQADAVESYILDTLRRIAEEGVPQDEIEAQLHQLELSQREITGDDHPYGLHLLLHALTPALHDAPIVPMLDIDPVLQRLRKKIRDPEFIKREVRKLLQNPHRVTLTMEPDPQMGAKEQAEERQRLDAIRANMDEKQVAHVIEQARALKARQEQADDPELLPKLEREDIPRDFELPQVAARNEVAGIPFTHYACATNGLCYAEWIVNIPEMTLEEQQALPFFASMADELGSAGRDYRQTQALQAAVSGGIHAFLSIHADAKDNIHAHYILAGKALHRNRRPFLRLMQESLLQLRLDESARMRELVAQARLRGERGVVHRGHILAMRAAAAALSPVAAMLHRHSGLEAIRYLQRLDTQIREEQGMQAWQRTLQRIDEALRAAPRQALFIAEAGQLDELQRQAEEIWGADANIQNRSSLQLPRPDKARTGWAWLTSTQVHFCARAYPAVDIEHEDAAALQVLALFLRNNFLHRHIREQGGAYGVGARFDPDSRAFCFFSYRDPRLSETLEDFDRSIDWLLNTRHEPRLLEEAVLGVIANIDAPGSPAGEAASTFHRMLYGRTPEKRRQWRQRVLDVTLDDLHRVGARWLCPKAAHTAVITHRKAAETLEDMEIVSLT